MKKGIKIIGIILAAIILIVAVYLAYVFISYHRIEDKLELNPDTYGEAISSAIESDGTYSILTYNIGFGAYTSEYSFFMDGGEYSWARSEEELVENISDIGITINLLNPDFAVLQEVDTNGTRSYHYNEYVELQPAMGQGDFVFAQNFDSPFLMYPLNQPHGSNESGLVTYSSYAIDNAIRRSLPISSSVTKIVDLDRCYSISRIPVDNGHYLCIYNVHLSAYTNDVSVRENQINMLCEDLDQDYRDGNYIIVGGDYNHNLRGNASPNVPLWASDFPVEMLPSGFDMAFNVCDDVDIEHDSCRNADAPYDPEVAFTVMVDGFIVSDNINVVSYRALDYQYAYSDHDPVVMEFEFN